MMMTPFGHGLKEQTPRKLNRAHSSRGRRTTKTKTKATKATTMREMPPNKTPRRDQQRHIPRQRSFVMPKTFGGR
jgi:hypothetical protein